jgi:hypothetical protein
MSIAAAHRAVSGSPQGELEEELRHVRDLVFVRDLLGARGATTAELRECDATINRARALLAEATRRASAPYAEAA